MVNDGLLHSAMGVRCSAMALGYFLRVIMHQLWVTDCCLLSIACRRLSELLAGAEKAAYRSLARPMTRSGNL